MNVSVNWLFIVTLALVSMLPPLATDMYLPAFLQIAAELQVEPEQIQHTLTFFTLGLAVGQLLWGPVGDSYGRKPIILLGLIVAAFASSLLVSIKSIEYFTAVRFIQGFFGAAPVVLVGALMRDLFSKDLFSKMMSNMMMVMIIAPLLAPILGGYLTKWFHWHAIFYTLASITFFSALLMLWRIPETHHKEKRIPLHFSSVMRNFITLWRHKQVAGYMLTGSFSFAGMFAFLTAGSIVYIGIYGVAVEHFGYFFMLNIGVMFIGNLLNNRLVTKMGAEKMLRLGLSLHFLAGIWLFIVALFDLGFWSMALGIALFIGQNSLIGANAMASILDRFPHMAGTANSMAGTTRFGFGAIIGSLLALVEIKSAAPMLITMSVCSFVAVGSYYFLCYRSRDV